MQVLQYVKAEAIVIPYRQSEGPIIQSCDIANTNRSHNPSLNDSCKGCGPKTLRTQGMWYIVPVNAPKIRNTERQIQ
jgi:hypothetical protein